MALLGPIVDYTNKDFDSIRARLRNLIRSVFPTWTDERIANFGNILIELFAHVADILTKYQDNQAREAFWGRVTQRKNILALAKMIGFVPSGNTAAQVDVSFALAAALAGDVTIPARTRILTESVVDPVVYETLEEVVIAAGSTGPVTVTAENAELREEIFTSSGLANQEIRLSGTPYLDDSLELSAANGSFELVDNFLDSDSGDRHVTITVDQNDRATIRFGNGTNGALPVGSIAVSYKIGGGANGRVEAGKLVKLESSLTDEFGNAARLTITNASASSYAVDRQTVEQIRALGPQSLRVLERTVAREDFEIHANQISGVARALMLTSDQAVGIPENTGHLIIIPTGGGVPTQELKDAVLEMVTVTKPCTLTFEVEVFDPDYLEIDISATVHFAARNPTTAQRASARAAIEAALEEAFAIVAEGDEDTTIDGIDFGYYVRNPDGTEGSIAWSDVFNVVRDAGATAGIRKIDSGATGFLLNGAREDVAIGARQFPTLGTVTLIDAATNDPF